MTLPYRMRADLAMAAALALLSLVTAACIDPPTPPTLTPTAMLIPSPTIAPTLAPTARPTPSSAPTPVTPSPLSTPTATLTPTPTSTPTQFPIPTPTATPTPSPTPTATPTPTAIATPTPTPTLTPEEEAHAALSQLLPWYDDPPYPLAVVPILEVWVRDPGVRTRPGAVPVDHRRHRPSGERCGLRAGPVVRP